MGARIDIGIDGGGTGCRIALAIGDEVSEVTGGPANIVTDPAGAEASIRLALTEVLTARGLSFDDLPGARICAGLAGARLPGMADAFATRLPFLAYVVDDSVTSFAGAFAGGDGCLASLGTGSFFIRRAGDDLRHIGGWGFQLGDEGSAAWLGRRALSRALHAADGRVAADALTEAVMAAAPPHPVLFARDAAPGDFAQIARLVIAHRETPTAQALIADVLAAVEAGLRDVGYAAGEPLVVTGGLGTLLAPLLPDALSAVLQNPAGRPLDGALRLARGLP